ncbi:MAG: hypothetical protein QME74_08510 [Candidatus Edwardsbacteria bacterium]|nr:hypothetical protein [Candidatus Edwardsbacteria bacterium]
MKRVGIIAVDAILLLVLLYCCGIVWMLAAGFLEIILSWNVCFTTAGGIVISLLTVVSVIWFYYLWPREKFQLTPGQSLVTATEQGHKPRSAFFWYCRVLGVLLFAYLLAWLISAAVFGSLIHRQQRVLETLGVPSDWKEAFPAYDSTGNAARYFDAGPDTVNNVQFRPVREWFSHLTAVPDSIRFLAPKIDNLLAQNKQRLAAADQGLLCSALVWTDYRSADIDTFYRIRLPNYMRLQDLTKLYMLAAEASAYRKDWNNAQAYCGRACRLISLQRQDPTLIGKMIAVVETGIVCEGLIAIAKQDRGEQGSYTFVRRTCEGLPPLAGQVRQGMIAEFATMTEFFKVLTRKMSIREMTMAMGYESAGERAALVALSPIYRIWSGWDLYCGLRTAEYSIAISSPENNAAAVEKLLQEYERFAKKRLRLPALLTSIATPNFTSMYQRELEARAKPGAVALLAATLDYRRSRGKYPDRLEQLVPQYFRQLPVSPVDGKGYRYVRSADTLRIYTPGSSGSHIPKTTFIILK